MKSKITEIINRIQIYISHNDLRSALNETLGLVKGLSIMLNETNPTRPIDALEDNDRVFDSILFFGNPEATAQAGLLLCVLDNAMCHASGLQQPLMSTMQAPPDGKEVAAESERAIANAIQDICVALTGKECELGSNETLGEKLLGQINALVDESTSVINLAPNYDVLERMRSHYLGKYGVLTLLMHQLNDVPPGERPAVGGRINQARSNISESVLRRREQLRYSAND